MRVTVCLSVNQTDCSIEDFLEKTVKYAPASPWELRLGFDADTHAFHYSVGLLCGAGSTPVQHLLPDDVERFHWLSRDGLIVRAWLTSEGSSRRRSGSRAQLTRLVCHDVPLESEYVIFLEGSCIKEGWWELIEPLLNGDNDYIGHRQWTDYSPDQLEQIQLRPWYMGVPFEKRDGRPGVSNVPWGMMAVKSQRLREANFPEPRLAADGIAGCGSDVLLGEIARQLGWKHKDYQTEGAADRKDKKKS